MKTAIFATLIAALSSAVFAEPDASPKGATNQARATLASVYSSCTKPKTVALTFDDGPYVYLCVSLHGCLMFTDLDLCGVQVRHF